jgi:FXSXX-COOH protein
VGVVDRTAENGTGEWPSALVDLSALTPAEVAALPDPGDDSALAHCLRRLADEMTEPGEPIAGFNSAL